MNLVLIGLATVWAWMTLRYLLEIFAPLLFQWTRPLHPIIIAAGPLWLVWPDWLSGLAVAGAVGIFLTIFDRFVIEPSGPPVAVQQRRTPGSLPPLP